VQLLSAGAELMRQSVIAEEEAEQYYQLLHCYLTYLPTVTVNPVLIFWRYIYSYLRLGGITLAPDSCTQCSADLGNPLYYSISKGGFVCSTCHQNEAILRDLSQNDQIVTLTGVAAEIMRKLPVIGNYLSELNVDLTTFNLINKLFLHYLRFHLHPGIHFTSLKNFVV
jgi:recombinational DNA repair protein (RecF pathway)